MYSDVGFFEMLVERDLLGLYSSVKKRIFDNINTVLINLFVEDLIFLKKNKKYDVISLI